MSKQEIKNKIDELDGQTILLILSHLTERLQKEIPPDFANTIQGEKEARSAILRLLESFGEDDTQIASDLIVREDANFVGLGRKILKLLVDDEAACPKVEHLVSSPPRDSQMSVELAVAGAIILGVVITWLQTKINIKVTRKNGNTDFKFELQKDAADTSVIKNVAESVSSLLKGF